MNHRDVSTTESGERGWIRDAQNMTVLFSADAAIAGLKFLKRRLGSQRGPLVSAAEKAAGYAVGWTLLTVFGSWMIITNDPNS